MPYSTSLLLILIPKVTNFKYFRSYNIKEFLKVNIKLSNNNIKIVLYIYPRDFGSLLLVSCFLFYIARHILIEIILLVIYVTLRQKAGAAFGSIIKLSE